MKILHVSLCGSYTDRLSYQENLLTKYHKKLEHEVSIIATKYHIVKGEYLIDKRDEYYDEEGVKIIRIPMKYNTNLFSKFRRYGRLYEKIKKEKPEILFIHNCQFLDITSVVKYIKNNPSVKVYVDNHSDFSNSATNWLSKNILHKIIWKRCAKLIEPYAKTFYGVLPSRVEFLENVYEISPKKTKLLVMGADDDQVIRAKTSLSIKQTKEKYKICENDIVIVTGGKIDLSKKQVLSLIKAIKEIGNPNIKLIVFGSVHKDLKKDLINLCENQKINYIGWLDSKESYNLFEVADLVVFPGRHSVYWEQVVGQGKAMVVKHWEGTDHIDLGGNVKFFYEDSVEEYKKVLLEIIDKKSYQNMSGIASKHGVTYFSYLNIARRSLD